MPFTLTVTKGAGVGAEFPFDSAEARLGRTADNDIVVKDSGASRSHARVFTKHGRYWVEDMKSANGTKLNGTLINSPRELKNGDTITIGEVTFTFTQLMLVDQTVLKPPSIEINETVLKGPPADDDASRTDPGASTDEQPALDLNATMLKAPLAARAADPERERRTTAARKSVLREDETVPPSRAQKLALDDNETVPPSRALQKKADDDDLKASDDGTLEVKVPPALVRRGGRGGSDVEDDELTAADKLRMRRQANKTALGRLEYGWKRLPTVARIGTAAAGALFVLGAMGFLVVSALPERRQGAGTEPAELAGGARTVEASFGLGEGVTFERPDMKVFGFTVASPTRIVGVLHYQAKDISKDEVALSVNGFDLGFVPPDTLDAINRELELVVPAQQIKKGGANQLVFDNVKNPPGDEPWRIWNLWLELIAIPDLSIEETLTAVKEDLDRSETFFEQRDIGPDNLFKSWKGYRDAWLRMESMSNRPEELYIVARTQQREIAQRLDKRCSMMVLSFQQAMSAKKPDRRKGREIAEEMLRYFPSREHRCHGLARELLEDLGGL